MKTIQRRVVATPFALALGVILLLGGSAAYVQSEAEPIMVAPGDFKWLDFPGIPGRKVANIEGGLNQAGPYIVRVMLPAGSKLPPHWHSIIDHITVISGTFFLGMGAAAEEGAAKTLPAGSAIAIPPKLIHYGFVKEDTILQLHGVGPYDTHPSSQAPR